MVGWCRNLQTILDLDVIDGQKTLVKSDVYSLKVVLLELIMGAEIFGRDLHITQMG